MNNLELYEKVRKVPDSAQKAITGGRLKGMTDINPMWRIKTLTEQFGVCGVGWYPEIVKEWIEKGAGEEITANVELNLYIKLDGEWSKPIPGVGGSKFVAKENSGFYTDDECYKKAYTDALSVACKALGIGADVYWQKDESKYNKKEEETLQKKKEPSGKKSTTAREDFKNHLTEIGMTDAEKTAQWFEEQYEKPFEKFSKEDIAECLAFAKGRIEAKRREAANA